MLILKLIRNALIFISCYLFCGVTDSYAWQNPPQIDSLINVANQINNADESIEKANRAYINSKAFGYVEGMVKSMLVIADKAFDVGRYEMILKSLDKIEDLAIKLRNNSYLSHIYTLKGMSYSNLGFYDECNTSLVLAKSYAEEIKESDKRHYHIGNVYIALSANWKNKSDDMDSVLFYGHKSYAELKQISSESIDRRGFILATSNLGAYYRIAKQFDSAEIYLNRALSMGDKKGQNILVNSLTLEELGALFLGKQNYQKALEYYLRALRLATDIKNNNRRKVIYLGLSKSYEGLNNNELAQEFLKKHVYITDSLNKADKKAIKTPLNNIIKVKDRNFKSTKDQYVFSLALVLGMLAAAVWGFWIFFKRFKREQITNAEQAELLEEKMRLIDYKDSRGKTDVDELKTVVQLAIANDPAFFVKFNELDPEFNNRLLELAPKLVAGELEFCAFLRLNFETKEIARYTGLSVRAVEGKKYRIRKKLNISSDEDINIWMTKL